jgi:hypothetical protein
MNTLVIMNYDEFFEHWERGLEEEEPPEYSDVMVEEPPEYNQIEQDSAPSSSQFPPALPQRTPSIQLTLNPKLQRKASMKGNLKRRQFIRNYKF